MNKLIFIILCLPLVGLSAPAPPKMYQQQFTTNQAGAIFTQSTTWSNALDNLGIATTGLLVSTNRGNGLINLVTTTRALGMTNYAFGISDDSVAFQSVINVASGMTNSVFVPAGAYKLNGNITVPKNVSIIGAGSADVTITHTGNNVLFTAVDNVASLDKRNFIGFKVIGNTNSGSAAIWLGGVSGCKIEDVELDNYGASEALRLLNPTNNTWTELTRLSHLTIGGCSTGIFLINMATFPSINADSMAEPRWDAVHITLSRPGSVGLRFGDHTFTYGANLNVKFNVEATNCTAVSVSGSATVAGNQVQMYMESPVAATRIATESNGVWYNQGQFLYDNPLITDNVVADIVTHVGFGQFSGKQTFASGFPFRGNQSPETMQQWKTVNTITNDGEFLVVGGATTNNGLHNINGTFDLVFYGPSRFHHIRFSAGMIDGEVFPVIYGEVDAPANNQRCWGLPFWRFDTNANASPCLFVPLSNRNGGSNVSASVSMKIPNPEAFTICGDRPANLGNPVYAVRTWPGDGFVPGFWFGDDRAVIPNNTNYMTDGRFVNWYRDGTNRYIRSDTPIQATQVSSVAIGLNPAPILLRAGADKTSYLQFEDTASGTGAVRALVGYDLDNNGTNDFRIYDVVATNNWLRAIVNGNMILQRGTFIIATNGTVSIMDGTLKQVTFGTNDSAGAGFKYLKIAN